MMESYIKSWFHTSLVIYIFSKIWTLLRGVGILMTWSSRSTSATESNNITDEIQSFFDVWFGNQASSIIFLALAIVPSDRDSHKIVDIGLSAWCPDGISGVQSLYWKVESPDASHEYIQGHRDKEFIFGDSQTISETEICNFFNDEFKFLAKEHRTIYLVGHKIESSLDSLSSYWPVPDTVKVFDICKLWQYQHREATEVSLIHCVRETPELACYVENIGNAGNDARLAISILQEIEDIRKKK